MVARRKPRTARAKRKSTAAVELEESRIDDAQLRLILEGLQDHAISMLDPEGRIVTWNLAAERIKGYTLDEVRGEHFSLLFTEDDRRARVPEAELEVARREGRFRGEGWRQRKDGSRFYASISLSALRDRGGALRGFVKVTHDTTGAVRAQIREEGLGALTAALAEAATLADIARVLLEQGARVLEAESASVWTLEAGDELRLLAHWHVPDAYMAAWRTLPLGGDSPAARVARTREPLWVEGAEDYQGASPEIAARARAAGRLNAFGAVPLVQGERVLGVLVYAYEGPRPISIEDRALFVTVAHHGTQSLDRGRLLDMERRANEHLQLVHETTTAIAASLEYETTLSNLAHLLVPALGDWCGVDLAEEGAVPELVAVAHADRAKERLAAELRTRYPIRIDDPMGVMQVLRTGEPDLVSEITDEMLIAGAIDAEHLDLLRTLGLRSAMILPLTARGRTFGTLTLISSRPERRYGAEDLALAAEIASRAALHVDNARLFRSARRAARRAEDASRSKDDFLATVSHELRTPLNAILGWARMLSTGELGADKHRRAIESIERNATAQAQLIEDLLDISRIISGKLRLEVRPVDLAKVIEAAVDSARPALDAKEIQFAQVLEPDASPFLGDAVRLQQVVWNLLSNAIKFTPKGGRIQVFLHRVNSHVELSIADSGDGIAPEFFPHVFERFLQADASTTRKHGGLGLGLSICRSLVELHGGTIEADSAGVGQGATFIVKLPRSPLRYRIPDPTREHPTAEESIAFEAPAELAGLRVLVVDDEEDARDLIVTILSQCGAEARAVPSMGTALDELRAWKPDVLLSDIGMPDGDGYDLIRSVRGLPPGEGGTIPAGALTAYARADDRRRALVAGYQMHVPKPVEPAELAAVVVNLARIGRSLR